jgi:hypothetical protein
MTATPEEQARRIAQMVRDGIASPQNSFEHVVAEQMGTALGRLVNGQRGTAPQQPQKPQEGNKS